MLNALNLKKFDLPDFAKTTAVMIIILKQNIVSRDFYKGVKSHESQEPEETLISHSF